MKPGRSLRRSLPLMFIFTAVLPLMLFGSLAMISINKHLREEVESRNLFLARAVAKDAEILLRHVKAEVVLVGEAFRRLDPLTDSETNDLLQAAVDGNPLLESLLLLDPAGRVSHLGLSQPLESLRADFLGLDLIGHPLLQAGLDPEAVAWSDSFVSVTSGQPSVSLAVPLDRRILLANLNLQSLGGLLARFAAGNQGDFAIVDRNGTLVAHTQPSLALQRNNFLTHSEVARALQGEETTQVLSHAAEMVLESVVPIGSTRWAVWVGQPLEKALHPLRHLRDLQFSLLVVALVLGALMAWSLSRRLVGPLVQFRRTVGALAAGEYQIDFKPTAFQEIAELTGSFQAMAKAVRQREEALRQSEVRYRSVVQTMAEGLMLYDADGRIEECNPAAEAILEQTREQILARDSKASPWQTFREDQTPWPREEYPARVALASGRVQTGRIMGLARPGEEIKWIRINASPLAGGGEAGGGRVAGVVATFIDITDQVLAERELRASESRFRLLADTAPVMIWMRNTEGTFTYFNRGWQEFSGRSLGNLKEERENDWTFLVHPEDLEIYLATFAVALARREPFSLEYRMRRHDGIWRWILDQGTPRQDDKGGFFGFIGCALDITERRQMESELRDSREQLLRVFQGNLVGMAISRADTGSFIDVNETFCRILGYDRRDLLGPRFSDLGILEAHLHERLMREVKASGALVNRELTLQTRSGASRQVLFGWVSISFGGRECLLATLVDITEKQEAEARLRRREEQYRKLSEEFQALLDGIPDDLVLVDPNLRVIWANRAAQARGEVPGGPAADYACRDLCNGCLVPCKQGCPVRRSLESGQMEEDLLRGKGEALFGIKAFPLKDGSGHVTRVIKLATDVTEKMRLREEADRNSRLAALGELAAGVAHEINNPTGLILMNLPLLEEVFADALPALEDHFGRGGGHTLGGLPFEQVREELPDLLESLHDGAKRIRHIVEELRDFSRGGDGGEQETFDLNRPVEKALRLMASLIDKATDRLVCRFDNTLPHVRGDLRRLEQVVINLLLNACQALPDPSKGLTVVTRWNPDAGRVELEVRDEGTGIAPEVLDHITDPFFTTKREQGGTGLGLSVSQRIVREHDGHLHFFSTAGEGTTVLVQLPPARKEAEA